MKEAMNAGDICNRTVTIAERGMPLTEAAQLMRERHVGCLVVVDEIGAGRIVVGMLTDRDIVTSVVAKAPDPAQLVVGDVMGVDVITALKEDSIPDMLSKMRHKGLRRLPVVTARWSAWSRWTICCPSWPSTCATWPPPSVPGSRTSEAHAPDSGQMGSCLL